MRITQALRRNPSLFGFTVYPQVGLVFAVLLGFESVMSTRRKYTVWFGIAGFAIGVLLLVYAQYFTSHYERIAPDGLIAFFLILCPPSIGTMALDGASKTQMLVGHFFICLENAVLYGLIGLGIGSKIERHRRLSSLLQPR